MVYGYLVEPGPELAFVFQFVDLLEDSDKDILGKILSFIFLFHIAKGQIVNLSLVERHQPVKGLMVPLAEGADKLSRFLVWHCDPLAHKSHGQFLVCF